MNSFKDYFIVGMMGITLGLLFGILLLQNTQEKIFECIDKIDDVQWCYSLLRK